MADAGAYAGVCVGADASTGLRTLCLAAAAAIRDECEDTLQQASVKVNAAVGNGRQEEAALPRTDGTDGAEDLAGCGEPLVQLLSRQASRLLGLYDEKSSSPLSLSLSPSPACPGRPVESDRGNPGAVRPCRQGGHGRDDDGLSILGRLDDLVSIAYSRFYAYRYHDLPLCWRQLYTDASILKFVYLYLSSPKLQTTPRLDGRGSDAAGIAANGMPERDVRIPDTTRLDELVKTLDLALILAGAGGHKRGRRWIDAAFDLLEGIWGTVGGEETRGGSPLTDDVTPPAAKRPRLELPPTATTEDSWHSRPSFSTHEPFTPPIRNPIRRVAAHTMDMAAFQRHLDSADPHRGPEPLVLTGLVDDWPARAERPWDKPSYLMARTFGGRRLVPVEIGRSYVDEGWGQKIVPFGEFLSGYVDTSLSPSGPAEDHPEQDRRQQQQEEEPVAYLAQHQLFLQLPQLRHDILIPDQCYTAPPAHPTDPSQDQQELEAPLLNAWLGPPGTITPLHTDPYHNLLAQVVGRKYVRLYSPHETERMRARGKEGGVEMGNTSLLDVGVVEGWDVDPAAVAAGDDPDYGDGDAEDEVGGAGRGRSRNDDIEDFRQVPFVDCILEPGDALYIPIGWWHYVRGLSVSFSVSLWWN
ncbi:hypothetical protein VPNG_03211 [Cytospora leucostoma]|uniref:JmjC domain-containing protein n=1 Tax=Cytospora leucostoma TaxID=1230097 RepID=A0A423XFA7_9PEZI|nr:hypothetical protein VPNG_03211 [Cytospora leucostoma]